MKVSIAKREKEGFSYIKNWISVEFHFSNQLFILLNFIHLSIKITIIIEINN